jgi:hypothetical protein
MASSYKEGSSDVGRLFEQKKNQRGCPDYTTTLKGNARTFVNLREKKMLNLTRFSRALAAQASG